MSHSSPSSAASGSPVPPPTPLTPSSVHGVHFAQPQADQFSFDGLNLDNNTGNATAPGANGGPVRRKPSRRANTAERRATHNAVERQRRETLNGRFLDLAALLPNLASVRRPSKSAIVNSSIALIHTQRRARSTAARELRLLKLEADALRAEVNEWRERAGMGLARIDEPLRSREFEELVSGGLEEAEEGLLEEERRALEIVKEGLRMDASAGLSEMMINTQGPFAYNMNNGMYGGLDEEDDESSDGQASRMRPGSQGSVNSIPSLPMPIAIPRQTSMNTNPMIFDPSAALLQSHPTHHAGINGYSSYDLGNQTHASLGLAGLGPVSPTKAQWNNSMFSPINQQNYGQQQSYGPSGNFLGGFGLREEDNTDASSNASGSVPELSGFVHPGMNHRSRSASNLANIQTNHSAGSPPSSAPPSATTYAEANSAGDAFAAAYGAAFPVNARVPGGGNTYGASMGLFM